MKNPLMAPPEQPVSPLERSPLEYSFGVLITPAPGYGQARGFAWFEDAVEALNFWREAGWRKLFKSEISDSQSEAVSDALMDYTRLDSVAVSTLNSVASNVFEIRWQGTFDQLRGGRDPLAQAIRHEYIDGIYPIPAESDDLLSYIDEFAEHLTNYRHNPAPEVRPPRNKDKVIAFHSHAKPGDKRVPPRDRDPRRFPYGLLLVESKLFDGVDGFSWFANEAAAAEYLRSGYWEDLGFGTEHEGEVRGLFFCALQATSRINEGWLGPVNRAQDRLNVIWHGTFDQLWDGKDAFAAGVVDGFRAASASSKSDATDVQEFVRHLDTYKSTVPDDLFKQRSQ